MTYKITTFVAAAVLCAASANALEFTEDFENVDGNAVFNSTDPLSGGSGNVTWTLTADAPYSIFESDRRSGATPVAADPQLLTIKSDSQDESGDDDDADLATGSALGQTDSAREEGRGQVLVFQEQGRVNTGDNGDENFRNDSITGGTFTFHFDTIVDLVSVTIQDLEGAETFQISVGNDVGLNEILLVENDALVQPAGNAQVQTIVLADFVDPDELEFLTGTKIAFEIVGSASLVDFTVTPIPGAVAMFIPAIAGLAWMRRRQRAA